MTTPASNPRQQRGLELARAKRLRFRRITEHTWLVPSATHARKTYVVTISRPSCTCPDFASGANCKHLWAVRYFENEITLIDGTHLTPPPITDADHTAATLGLGGAA